MFEKWLNFDDCPILWQQYLVPFCCMSSIIWLYGIDYIDIYLVTCQTKFMRTVKGIFYCSTYSIILCEFIENWSMEGYKKFDRAVGYHKFYYALDVLSSSHVDRITWNLLIDI